MATPSRIPYPPCVSDSCSDRECCAEGYKFQWPELVGTSGHYARGVIEADNPIVTVMFVPHGAVGIFDFCCNRVYIYLDSDNKVLRTPLVG